MTIPDRIPTYRIAGLLFCLSLTVPVQAQRAPQPSTEKAHAQISRTGFGVPHIRAEDERGLGYGVGYAYGQDNLCLLANEIVTVNGERSRYFGPEEKTRDGRANLTSDQFFNWLNTPQAVSGFWQAQPPQIRQLLEGYAAGFNRALSETPAGEGTGACLQAAWLRPVTPQDLVKLTRRLQVEGGLGQFAETLVGAKPPGRSSTKLAANSSQLALAAERMQQFAQDRGSNAVAIGRDRSFNGRGMLLANPHFPWNGGLRFYQMHLTIPGKLDVMGAALPGLPVINIGFSQHLAWTHTVDTSRHFTLYRLTLDPKDPTRYLFDGQSRALKKQTVTTQVRDKDGQLSSVSRVIYSSGFGPIVQWPGKLDWDARHAYSLRDANLDNDRTLQQWYAMDSATSLEAFEASLKKIQGIPWVNTLVADDQGQTLYMNYSVVPNVDHKKLAACGISSSNPRFTVLDGSRSGCTWANDNTAAQPGIFPVSALPSLARTDYVQNSNDSAWMTNPAHPLTGFSPLISLDGQPLGARMRFAVERLVKLNQDGKVSVSDLQHMVMDNRVYLAESGGLLDDLLRFCSAEPGAHTDALKGVCVSLGQWDRTANLDAGLGFVHFQNVVQAVRDLPGVWRIAFDPRNPLHTPRGLALDRPEVIQALRTAMLASAEQVSKAGLKDGSQWGDVQMFTTGSQQTPIHGGPGLLGVYNAITSVPRPEGKREVVSGSSYLQVVSFDEHGPHAQGLLTFSESSDAASAHASDQTQAFSKKQWSVLPFTEQQIKADPAYRVQMISEGGP